jgi:putative membrane protein
MALAPALMAFVHHLAAFTLAALLVFEHAVFTRELSAPMARKILRVDLYYGITAGVLLVVGLLRVLYFEKGATYYFSNGWFLAKLGLFALIGLTSSIPRAYSSAGGRASRAARSR